MGGRSSFGKIDRWAVQPYRNYFRDFIPPVRTMTFLYGRQGRDQKTQGGQSSGEETCLNGNKSKH